MKVMIHIYICIITFKNLLRKERVYMKNTTQKSTACEQVINHISEIILSGDIAPGEKLPTERAFADELGVTRSCIREALRALELIGMVTIRPGGGTYVSNNTHYASDTPILWMYYKYVHNFTEIYHARELIETEIYLECFDNMSEECRSYIREARDFLLEINTDEITPEEHEKILSDIDLKIGEFSGDQILCQLLQTMLIIRKECSLYVLSLINSRESSVYYRCKVLTAMLSDDRKLLKTALKRFFTNSYQQLTLK